jgi:multiple sugar transport system permease protein
MMTTLTKTSAPAGNKQLQRPPKRRRPAGLGDLRIALLFILPAMIGFIVFYVVPTVRGVYLSFTEYNILGDPEWVGFDNYAAITKDPLFWNSLAVTGQYVLINIALQTALALGLALLMHKVAKSTLVRGALLLPYLMSNVIAALLWFWMLDYQIGVVNQFIDWSGLSRIAFFGSEEWAIPTQALINTWRHMGYTALLIFAGLQAIPHHLYEGSPCRCCAPSWSWCSS